MKKLILLLVGIFLISLVSATLVFKSGEIVDLKISCFGTGDDVCSSSSICNITINYPNMTIFIKDGNMTNQRIFFNYTLGELRTIGKYNGVANCKDGSFNGYIPIDFEVTETGIELSTASGTMYAISIFIISVFLILTIYGFFKTEKIEWKFGLFQFTYLLLLGLIFIIWDTTNRFLLQASFIVVFFKIVFWILTIAYFPLLLCSSAWLVYTIIRIKEIENMMGKGLSKEEVMERRKRR